MASKIKSGDTVQVIAGKDKGKRGRVLKVLPADEKVLVEGVNKVTKHRRPTQQNPKGERRRQDAPIHVSNVMLVDPETSQPTRVRFEVRNGAKHRIAVKSGADLGRV
jgi:large subunit ribosomal protein L24